MDLNFKNKKVINITKEYFETEDEKCYFFGGMGHDATELLRRNLEENAFFESKEKYQNLLESINEAYFEVDLKGNFVFFNNALVNILGYSKDELIGMNNRDYMSPKSAKEIFSVFEQIYKTGKSVRKFGYEVIKKDGTHNFHQLTASLMLDKKGNPIGFRGIGHDVTELVQVEGVLLESEKKYRTILENIEEGYFEVDIAGNFTFFNDSLCRMLGYSKDEMMGMGNQQYTDQEERKKLFRAFNKVYKTGEPTKEFDWEIITKDGMKRYVETSVSLLKNSLGKSIGFYGIVRDVTNQKLKVDKILNEKEERFQNFAESLPLTLFEMDRNGKLIYVNRKAFSLFRYTKEQFERGLNGFDLIVPEDRERMQINVNNIINGGVTTPAEYSLFRGDGSRCFIRMHSLPVFTDGELTGFQGFIMDITDRKQLDMALQESEEKYRIVVEKANDAIVILQDGVVEFSNTGFTNMLGYTVEEAKGMPLKNFIISESLELVLERYKKRMLGKELSPLFEIILVKKSGEKIVVETSGSIIHLQGKLADVVIIRDITEQKKLEKILLESERLAAVGEMSIGVAHDFNNSLQMIFGNLDLALLSPDLSQEVVTFINSSRRAAKDAAARVRQLQRFAQKEQNNVYKSLDLHDILNEVTLQLRPLWKDSAEKKGLTFSIQKSFGKIELIDGNEGELTSVFHNVIKNGLEAMPNGGKIVLETSIEDNEICVRISDTGIGMHESIIKRIFQPFFTTKGFEVGRGLGMSAVFGIVRDHGGKIFVKNSEIGKGTTMELTFPLGVKKFQKEKKAAISKTAKVLWVDDEVELRNIGKMFLEILGYSGDVAGSGKEALELLRRNKYDLMITDIGMPEMNGWQLAEEIKDKYPMKVAVISGWGSSGFNEERSKYNVGYILGKPVGIEEIKDLVSKVFE